MRLRPIDVRLQINEPTPNDVIIRIESFEKFKSMRARFRIRAFPSEKFPSEKNWQWTKRTLFLGWSAWHCLV